MKLLRTIALSCVIFTTTVQAESKVKPLMKDFIGLNGHFKFKPQLYRQVCGLVRNYHNIDWDVKNLGDPPTFPQCVNKVDWKDHVYGKWKQEGFSTDLCAMFGRFGASHKDYLKLWEKQEDWIYQYGFEMAKYFGPSGAQKLITSIEIGNEPGKNFDDDLYQKIFIQMAKGIRAADSKIKIVTATAHADPADTYTKSLDETFSSVEIKSLYDIINLHVYAALPKKEGRSPWARSYPEDPKLKYLKTVDKTIAWRNQNAADKDIWITEFGYDSCTPEALKKRTGWAKKLNWLGVSDQQQAQYLIRSIFCFAERDVDRAYIYYYDDEDKASVHAASGLTRKFKPKMSFWAVKHFYETLGNYRFNRVIKKEQDHLYIYEFAHADENGLLIWVLWSPTGIEREKEIHLHELPGKILKTERMPLKEDPPKTAKLEMIGANAVQLKITESPLYILMKNQD